MKTLLKILLFIAVLLIVIVGGLSLIVGNNTVLTKVTETAIAQSGLDINYSALEGDLFGGLTLKGFNYQNSIKADLAFKADFAALSKNVVHIEDINISNLWIDEAFLKSLGGDANTTTQEESAGESPIKRLLVDHLTLNLVDFDYDTYHIDDLTLHVNDLDFDMQKNLSAQIEGALKSSMADAVIKGDIKESNYYMTLDATPKAPFINSYLKEQNATLNTALDLRAEVKGDLNAADATVVIKGGEVSFQEFIISPQTIINRTHYQLKSQDMNTTLEGLIESNVASVTLKGGATLNLADLNNTLQFNAHTDVKPKEPYFTAIADEQNLTIASMPILSIASSGTMQNVQAHILTTKGKMRYQTIDIETQNVDIDATYALKSGDTKANIDTKILTNLADLIVDGNVSLNTNDLNNSLLVDLDALLKPKEEGVSTLNIDENLTIYSLPDVAFNLQGDSRLLHLNGSVKDGHFSYDAIEIKPKETDVNATYALASGALNAKVDSIIDSNIVKSVINADLSGNTNDLNNTLSLNADANLLIPKNAPLSNVLGDENLTITRDTNLLLHITTKEKLLRSDIMLEGGLQYDAISLFPKVSDSYVAYDLESKALEGDIRALLDSSHGSVNAIAKAKMNLRDINTSLVYDAQIDITQTKPYAGVDLSSLGKIDAKANGSLKYLDAQVKANALDAKVKSSDLDYFDIALETKRIEIGKLYRYLPTELQESFVELQSRGYYQISTDALQLDSTLHGFKYAGRVISTSPFRITKKADAIRIDNLLLKADGFEMQIDADASDQGINATIVNQAINAQAKMTKAPFYVEAKADVDSIKTLINEINKIYPLHVGMEIDGPLHFEAGMQGNDATFALTSPKIAFEDGRLEALNLSGLYNPLAIRLQTFDFDLKGFETKEMNRHVGLEREGLITLDENNSKIDLALKNLLTFTGEQKGDVTTGKLSAQNLILAYKNYGYTNLTSELDMYQSSDKLAVTGFIEFKDTEISYESSFLDVSKDPDIVIITRESKAKSAKEDSDFKQNTFLDLDIRAKNEMTYKVDAGEIAFKPDMNIRKELGSDPKINGKVNVIDGQYDFADKRFEIEEGTIAFRGQEGTNPLLDLHVNYEEIEDVVIMIAIGGDKNRPKLTFSSKPMMSQKDIFSYLLFGFSVSESDGAAASAQSAAEKIFGRAVAKDLARELGLDRLDMTRNQLGGIDVKAGKKVTRKSILYYQNRTNESSLLYERKLNDKWTIETEVGKMGQGVDFFYRKGYK